MVDKIFQVLNSNQEVLDNTYVIFTSDHGYHLGQWRVTATKWSPYDTDIRVPLYMREPKIKPGSIAYDVW